MTLPPKLQVPTPPADAAAVAEQRLQFGLGLQALREGVGLSLEALAQTTRISVAFLQALESGQWEKLPGAVFARGFVRSISKTLGVEGDELLSSFDLLMQAPSGGSVLKVEIKNQPVRQRSDRLSKLLHNSQSLLRRGVLVQIAMPAVLLAVALYWLATSSALHRMAGHLREHASSLVIVPAKPLDLKEVAPSPEAPPAAVKTAPEPEVASSSEPSSPALQATVQTPEPATEPAAAPAADPAAVASDGAAAAAAEDKAAGQVASSAQTLVLTVTSPVKIRIDVDKGKGVVKELAPDTYRFTFQDKADMMIYDASAVKIAFNGKALGTLGSKGRVRRLSFAAQTGKRL